MSDDEEDYDRIFNELLADDEYPQQLMAQSRVDGSDQAAHQEPGPDSEPTPNAQSNDFDGNGQAIPALVKQLADAKLLATLLTETLQSTTAQLEAAGVTAPAAAAAAAPPAPALAPGTKTRVSIKCPFQENNFFCKGVIKTSIVVPANFFLGISTRHLVDYSEVEEFQDSKTLGPIRAHYYDKHPGKFLPESCFYEQIDGLKAALEKYMGIEKYKGKITKNKYRKWRDANHADDFETFRKLAKKPQEHQEFHAKYLKLMAKEIDEAERTKANSQTILTSSCL